MKPHEELEQKWAEFNGTDPAGMVGCASGTAALHLAFEALRLPPGSGVVVPDLTMVACARAVVAAGLVPVFADVDERGILCLDSVDEILSRAGPGKQRGGNVRAVLPVHLYGRVCDMDALHIIAGKYGIHVVEDLAEAHGVRPHPLSDAACWSFYRNKIVAGEEGGAVSFQSPERAAYARSLRCLGFTSDHDFRHIPRGWNHRLSDAHARLILESLAAYPTNLERRRERESILDAACPEAWRLGPRRAPWVYDFRVRGMIKSQQDLAVELLQSVGGRHCFYPMTWQAEFYSRESTLKPRSVTLSSEIIYISLAENISEISAMFAFRFVDWALKV